MFRSTLIKLAVLFLIVLAADIYQHNGRSIIFSYFRGTSINSVEQGHKP